MTEEQQPMIPMSPGERLRHAREQRGLSVPEAARQLHSSTEVVTAIEDDNHARLAPVYRQGFVRAYAELLELDPDEFQGLLDDGDGPALQSVFPEARTIHSSDRWLRAASYALASLLVGTLAWQLTHEAVRLVQLDDGAEVVSESSDSSAMHVNASIAALENMRPPAGSRGAAGQQAWAAVDEEYLEADEGEHLLELRASADSWVEITGRNGVQLERDLLRGGDVRRYRGTGPFNVSLGRSSAIQLFLDGNIVDLAPHTRDEVTRLVLNPGKVGGEVEDES